MDSRVIEVAIGLALVFAVSSLLVTTIVEGWSTLVKQRGRVLKQAVSSFVGDDPAFATSLFNHPLIVSLAPQKQDDNRKPSYIGADVMITALLGRLTERYAGGVRPTSPAELVATIQAGGAPAAILAGTTVGASVNAEFHRGLVSLVQGVENDWPAYEKRLQAWFDSVAERSSGWYKRWTQAYLFGIGVLTAAIFNINPIVIAPRLWNDTALRQAMVSAGEAASKEYEKRVAPAAGTDISTANTTAETPAPAANATLAPGTAPRRAVESTENHYATLLQALLAAAQRSTTVPAATRVFLMNEMEALRKQLDQMRTPDDRTITSLRARVDANASIDRRLSSIAAALPVEDAAYAPARKLRDALATSIEAERKVLASADQPAQQRPQYDCTDTEDAAARDLCLRLKGLNQLQEAGLPIGWSPPTWPSVAENSCRGGGSTKLQVCPDGSDAKLHPYNIFLAVFGWVLTGVATTLGAPFWFDMLSKFVKLRGSGTRIDGDTSQGAAAKPSTLAQSPTASSVASGTARDPMSDALNAAERALSALEVQRVQQGLGLKGSAITGYFDANTRVAIGAWQTAQGAEANNELTATQIQQLLGLAQVGEGDEYAG